MRPLLWDDGTTWDNLNARWSDGGSYVLEPGDEGYVNNAPASGAGSGTKKSNAMNETLEPLKPLLAQAKGLRAGATLYQVAIGLHHHTSTTLNAAILKLEGDPAAAPGSNANKGSQLVYKLCADMKADAVAALGALSNGTVKTLLSGYRDTMKRVHGPKTNAGWQAAGFTGNTAVPTNHEERQTLLAAMRSYLAAKPEYASSLPQPTGPALEVTAAAALALMPTFQAAFDLVTTKETDEETCKGLRDADWDALYKEVSGTISEIRGLLAADDPRWEAFGLMIPAIPRAPELVPGLSLIPDGPTRLALGWEPAVRASYYRLFIKVEGVDADFRFLTRDKDLDHLIKNLTSGTTVHVYVVAANEAGEAPPSAIATAVVL
jgi:hypothetical protein